MEGHPCKNGTSFGCGKKLPLVGAQTTPATPRPGPLHREAPLGACPSCLLLLQGLCVPRNTERGKKKQTKNNKKMGLKTLQQQMTWIKEWKMFSLGLLQTRNTSTDKDAATSVWVSKAGIKLTTIRVLSLFFSSAPVVYTSASLPAPCFDMLNKMYLFTVSQILS